jgi:hypothetical protein
LRFRLREALRPSELPRLLSRGAWVEESLSTRLDSVRAPDLLCVDEERLDPDDRFPEFRLERLLDEEERPFDFEELRELPELLLLDRDFCWGILPGSSSWIVRCVLAAYPHRAFQTRGAATPIAGSQCGSSNPQLSGYCQ